MGFEGFSSWSLVYTLHKYFWAKIFVSWNLELLTCTAGVSYRADFVSVIQRLRQRHLWRRCCTQPHVDRKIPTVGQSYICCKRVSKCNSQMSRNAVSVSTPCRLQNCACETCIWDFNKRHKNKRHRGIVLHGEVLVKTCKTHWQTRLWLRGVSFHWNTRSITFQWKRNLLAIFSLRLCTTWDCRIARNTEARFHRHCFVTQLLPASTSCFEMCAKCIANANSRCHLKAHCCALYNVP